MLGIDECAIAAALTRGERFGVLGLSARSLGRHLRSLRQMGTISRLAAERALDMSVAETASGEHTLKRMTEVSRIQVHEDGADVVVMGCAGMARLRAPLQEALGVPVIDPVRAAIGMAIAAVQADR